MRLLCLLAAILVSALVLQPSAFAQQSICAQVKIEILQELTLEREAFEARMTINNGVPGAPLDNLSVDISFADKNGQSVRASSDPNDTTARFFYRLQTGSAIPATVPGESSAKILWLIIPAPGAGGSDPKGELYSVGATLRYRAGGENQEVVVSPDTIFVKPMPALTLDYFLPNEVYGDDPFTENVVEPVTPFNLGVRVKNGGYGYARKLKIESAQPRIIENKLGLLVDFRILGSEVNGSPATPSLLCDFGDIPANRSGVARWLMISTLSGRFVEFTANYTHADELGGQLTSLFTGQPRTHFLVRDVLVDLPGRDAVRDFLAKDSDVLRVYESENADTVVTDLSGNSTVAGSGGRYTVTTAPAAGFMFIRLADPLGGSQTLKTTTRGDGRVLNPANAWLSQTWDRDGRRWIPFVNVFDVNNTAGLPYTLQYEPRPGTENRPPKLDPINDLATDEDVPLKGVPFNATDEDSPLADLTFAVSSSNPSLIPLSGVVITRNGMAQTMEIRPAANLSGSSRLTLTVSDGTSQASRSFNVSVRPVNDSPAPGTDLITRQHGHTVKVSAAQLLANDTDADSDSLTLTGVSALSAKGVTVRLEESWVFYLPSKTMNEADTFTYSVKDGHGGTGTGVVNVLVLEPDPEKSLNIVDISLLEDGTVRIDFVGIPGRKYDIQAAESLNPAEWLTLGAVTADDAGRFHYIDVDTAVHTTRFYRSLEP